MRTFTEVWQIKQAHCGSFFSPNNMCFFRSRTCEEVYGNKYFITSERYVNGLQTEPRKYTVREYDAINDKINTIGDFQAYKTRAQAKRAIINLLKG